jgi:hypothetical protein
MAKDFKGAKGSKEKKPKKQASDKSRQVSMTAKTLSEKIEVKLYQLDGELAVPYMRDGTFSFRVAFDGVGKKGEWRRFHRSKCPLISVTETDILQTENETAQRMLEQFSVPQKTFRSTAKGEAGKARPAGKFFIDVTKTETQYNIDLDEIFDEAAVA